MRNLLIIFVSIFLIGCSQKIKDPNNFTIISYGFAPININEINFNPNRSAKFYKVAYKWGIKFESKGCVVSDSLIKSVNENNQEALENIEIKFGYNWKEKFNKEVSKSINPF